jgi:arylformamidase
MKFEKEINFLKNYKYFLFFFIILIISLISIISSYIYYYNLEKNAKFRLYKDILYIENSKNVNYDIKYNSLDIYIPKYIKEGEKLPVMIFVHGGAWTEYFGNKNDRKNFLLKGIFFTDNNFILVNINYRVYPDYKYPTNVKDVAKSIKWVYENIEDYNGNKDLIFLKGHSAGAQLVSLVSTDEKYLKENNLDLSVIKGVVLLEGVGYDILKSREYDLDSQLVNRYLMFPFGEDENILKEASSINHINENRNIPPFLIFTAENTILRIAKIEALDFYLKLIDNNKYAEYSIVPSKNHSTLNKNFGEKDDFTTLKTKDFLKNIINKKIKR